MSTVRTGSRVFPHRFIAFFALVFLWAHLAGQTNATTPTAVYKSLGNGPRNTRVFSSNTICKANVHYLTQELFRIPMNQYNLGPPSCDGHHLLLTNVDGTITYADFNTGEIVYQFPLSKWGGRPVHPNSNPLIDPADISRSVIAITKAGDLGIVANAGPGLAEIYVFEVSSGNLVWQYVVDRHPASMFTASPFIIEDEGRRVVVIGTSSREEVFAANPAYPCCSSRGIMIALDIDTKKEVWRYYTTPEGYAGASIVGSTPAIDFSRKTIAFGTQNNYIAPQPILDCILAGNTNCTVPENHVDSLVVLNYLNGELLWANSQPGPKGSDIWTTNCNGVPPGQGNCKPYSGDDMGFIMAPMQVEILHQGEWVSAYLIGNKRADLFAYRVDNGQILWQVRTGPSSARGGGHAFGATWDPTTQRVFYGNNNPEGEEWPLVGGGNTTGSFVTAVDAGTGAILYQVPTPGGGSCYQGPIFFNGMIVCGLRGDPSKETVAIFDSDDGTLLHTLALGGLSGNPAVLIQNKLVVPMGYAFSPTNTQNDVIVLGLAENAPPCTN